VGVAHAIFFAKSHYLVFKICLFCIFIFLLVFNFLIKTLLPILSFELPDVTSEQPLNSLFVVHLLFVCYLFLIFQ